MRGFNLSRFAVGHPTLILFFILMLAAAGAMSYLRLGRAEDPDFTIKVAIVSAQWPGATAAEMRDQVADPIEKKLQELPFFDKVETYTTSGFMAATVTFRDNTPPDRVPDLFYQTRKKLDDLRPSLPQGVLGPQVNDEYGDVYSVLYMLTADGVGLDRLKDFGEDIRQRLLGVPGVNKVDLIGTQGERIFVEFSHVKLATLGIGPQAIFDSLARQNAVTPAGAFETGATSIPLRITGALDGVAAVEAVPVAVGDRVFRLGDIATVTRGLADPPASLVRQNGRPAIGIGISMVENGNIIALGHALDAAMAGIEADLPVGLTVDKIADQPVVVEHSIHEFVKSFAEALGDRAPGLVPVARAPHRHGGGALRAAGAGHRLLRDVADGHGPQPHHPRRAHHRARAPRRRRDHRHRDDGGEDRTGLGPRARSRGGLGHHRLPDADRHAGDGGGVHSGRLRRLGGGGVRGRHLLGGGDRADRVVVRRGDLHALPRRDAAAAAGARRRTIPTGAAPTAGSGRTIDACLRHRRKVVAATAAIFVAAILGFGNVQQQFFPISERPELFLQIKLPEGSSITATTAAVEEAEALLEGDSDVAHATAYVGQGSVRFWLGLNPQLPNPSFAEIVILSRDTEARERIKARLEAAVADGALSQARVRVDRFNFGPPVGHPVQFRVVGKDPQEVRRIAGEVQRAMAANPDVRDPHLQWNEMAPAIRLVVDQDRARALGLAPQDIAQTLQTLVSGLPVTEMRDGTDLVQVVARAVPGERLDVAGLADLTVASRDGVAVPLAQVARIEPVAEEPILWRRNRELMISVRADIADGVQAPDVTNAILPALEPIKAALPAGYRIETGGAIEESEKGNSSIFKMFPIMLVATLTHPDDPAAELRAGRHRAPDRAARDHRCVARLEPLRRAVRLRGAPRAHRADGDDHAQFGHPRRPDRGRRGRRAAAAPGDRRGDGAARAAGGADGAGGDPRDDPAVALGVLGADGDGDHGRAAGGDAADALLPAGALRPLLPGAAQRGRTGGRAGAGVAAGGGGGVMSTIYADLLRMDPIWNAYGMHMASKNSGLTSLTLAAVEPVSSPRARSR